MKLALKLKKLSVHRQEELTAFIFIMPFFLGYLIFYLLPIIYCFFISFIDFNGYANMSDVLTGKLPFVGLKNFKEIFQDKVAVRSITNTFAFSVMYVPLKTIGALVLALLMNKKLYLRGLSRSMMLTPYVANVVAIAIVFTVLLENKGPINELLRTIGFSNPPDWLLDKRTALPVVVMIAVWQTMSYTAVVFLAALQNVPEFLYEAATIDGANSWQKFINVTFPMISPTTFFVLINNIIQSFMSYALIKNLTNGGPGYYTRILIQNIIEEAFSYNHFSYATAQAVLLFIVILVITLIQWGGQKKWVHY